MNGKVLEVVLGRPPVYDEVEWRMMSRTREKDKASVAIYQTSRTAMDRLDEAYGVAGWSSAFNVLVQSPELWVAECTIQANGHYWTDVGGAENDPERPGGAPPYKSAYSDAFKRAAVQAVPGFRYLYTHTLGGNYYALKSTGSFYFHPDAEKEIERDVRVAIGRMWEDWNRRLAALDYGPWVTWAAPGDALAWAVDADLYETLEDARAAFASMIKIAFGGKLTTTNAKDAYFRWQDDLSGGRKDWD